jgi:hypothetical protein
LTARIHYAKDQGSFLSNEFRAETRSVERLEARQAGRRIRERVAVMAAIRAWLKEIE